MPIYEYFWKDSMQSNDFLLNQVETWRTLARNAIKTCTKTNELRTCIHCEAVKQIKELSGMSEW